MLFIILINCESSLQLFFLHFVLLFSCFENHPFFKSWINWNILLKFWICFITIFYFIHLIFFIDILVLEFDGLWSFIIFRLKLKLFPPELNSTCWEMQLIERVAEQIKEHFVFCPDSRLWIQSVCSGTSAWTVSSTSGLHRRFDRKEHETSRVLEQTLLITHVHPD